MRAVTAVRCAIVAVSLCASAFAAAGGEAPSGDEGAPEEALEPGSPEAIERAMRLIEEADGLHRVGRVARALKLAHEVARLAPGAPGAQEFLGEL